MSDYEPFYLEWWTEKDLKEGTLKEKYVKCEVCEEIRRNVIEPAVVFVKGDDNQIKNQIQEIQQNPEELKEFLKNHYKNIKGKTDTKPVCIFHCQKENEIWIRNYEEYEEYSKRRNEAIKEKEPFDEDFEIKWNEDLVGEFWKRIRAYRFAVDCLEEEIFEDIRKSKNKIDKLIFSYFKLLKEKESYVHDFRGFIFPKFDEYDLISLEETKNFYVARETLNFWFKNENLKFKKDVLFIDASFKDYANFSMIVFENNVYFYRTLFINLADFNGVNFKGIVKFFNVIFFYIVDFNKTTFEQNVDFDETVFERNANFMESEFKNKSKFTNITFKGNTNFLETKFQNFIKFDLKGNSIEFNLSKLWLEKESYIEILNLNTNRLILKNINNITDNFLFYDCEVKENLEIEKAYLNKMKFTNFDLSNAKNIHIEASDITEVKFVNIDWGKISENRICKELFEREPKKARETYRQLKLALDNQKDHITANEFYSLEMKAYLKSLCKDKKKQIRHPIKYIQDLIIFGLGWISSNFFQSIFRPLFWIIFFTILMTNKLFHWEFNKELISKQIYFQPDFSTYLNDMAKTLNIFKTFQNFNDVKNYEFMYFLYSIIIATLIYQLIIAIRRKVKR